MSLRGYWRTVSPPSPCRLGNKIGNNAFDPAMRMTKLTTIASTGRLMKRSVNDFIGFLSLRIYRGWISLWFGRELIVDRHRHPVAQCEYASAHNCFPRLQLIGNRYEIATVFVDAHKVLLDGLLRFHSLLNLRLPDY